MPPPPGGDRCNREAYGVSGTGTHQRMPCELRRLPGDAQGVPHGLRGRPSSHAARCQHGPGGLGEGEPAVEAEGRSGGAVPGLLPGRRSDAGHRPRPPCARGEGKGVRRGALRGSRRRDRLQHASGPCQKGLPALGRPAQGRLSHPRPHLRRKQGGDRRGPGRGPGRGRPQGDRAHQREGTA